MIPGLHQSRLLLVLAWRNLLRNRSRTTLTSLLIGIGLASLMLTDGLVVGTTESMIRAATGTFLGHAQVHGKGYLASHEVERTVRRPAQVLEALAADPAVAAFSPRVLAGGMVSSSANMASAQIVGINPDLEAKVSRVRRAIKDGTYLSGASDTEILLGEKMAKRLEVRLGDRIVVTTTAAVTGELAQELFRVSGIFALGNRQMDQGLVFVNLRRAQALVGLPGKVHQVAVRFDAIEAATDLEQPVWHQLGMTANDVRDWRSLMPSLSAVIDMSQYSTVVVACILFAVITLGVVNAMFMSLYERMYEFGVLLAVGTRRGFIFRLIMMETLVLSLVSAVVGVVLGGAVTYGLSVVGIDYTGLEISGATLQEPVRTAVRWQQFVIWPPVVMVLTLVAGLQPAWFAARLQPSAAMRRSL